MPRTILAFSLLGTALLAGCSKDSRSHMSATRPAAAPLDVRPADGETGVRLDAPVALTFAGPVDRDVVERDLHLISERGMTDTACPDSATMRHGGMSEFMTDTAMMRHMSAFHATPGRFSWSGSGTVCTLRPDSMMTPRTQYMIHMGREMMDMIGSRMGGGMMDGHGAGMMSGHMMIHFTTMDTTGGHDGHH